MVRELITPVGWTVRETGASLSRDRSQDLTQMHLAQDNDVVQALTPDRSAQPFGEAIFGMAKLVLWACPRCPWRDIGAELRSTGMFL